MCADCYRRHAKLSSRSPPSSPPRPDDAKQESDKALDKDKDQPSRCGECGVKTESAAALEAHVAAVHKNTYQCIKCQVSTRTRLRDVHGSTTSCKCLDAPKHPVNLAPLLL